MSLLIQNGEIVTAGERYTADILCEDETITRIDRGLKPPGGGEVRLHSTSRRLGWIIKAL